ncbi:MAG TPA: IS66 family transposase [Polyangiaceae bacterium]
MQRDWRDDRIAELEAELAAKDAIIAEQAAIIAEQGRRIAALEKQVAQLLEQLGQNSRNSHKPPSTDTPEERQKRKNREKKARQARKRGGQPGHRGTSRELVPPEKVSKFVDLFPAECENCWKPLPEEPDASATRYQQIEVPPLEPRTTEWRRHQVTCPCCGYKTRAAYDGAQIPASPFGPRLMAIMGLLTGVYHLGRRRAVELLSDIVGVRVSLGALSAVEERVSSAVQPCVDEAWERVRAADVKHTDGTSWSQGGVTMALWTLAATGVTVFKILADSAKNTLRPLYGTLHGFLVSDRAKALNFWVMALRQICWAHLLRKFISFSERAGPSATFGKKLLDYTGLVFDYWHDYKDGRLDRDMFVAWLAPVRQQLEATLEDAVAAEVSGLSGACADILEHRQALWNFVDQPGVEPTNNHAERELRAFVLWRKRSFGTQSDRGNTFAENLMTVAYTARKQHKSVLDFLTACCGAARDDVSPPSLFDTAAV